MFKKDKINDINTKKTIMNVDNPLFSFIKPQDNDSFSKMRGIDLQDLIYFIDNYYLELRNELGFDYDITFGLELELENTKMFKLRDKLINESLNGWIVKRDGTLNEGAEINSPVLVDISESWNELKKVCSIADKNAIIGPYSGGHIHIGTQVLGNKIESWLNFIKLWSVYENIIYRFAYGEYLTPRPCIYDYARPLADKFWLDYLKLKEINQLNFEDLIIQITHRINQAVNFHHVCSFINIIEGNTIEFRCPNGSVNPVVWQNNVNLFVNMLLYSKSSRFNDDIITNRRLKDIDKYSVLNCYNEIYLDQALELCDMLFNNNYDKVYFLRQYLKSFEVSSSRKLTKSKPFTHLTY